MSEISYESLLRPNWGGNGGALINALRQMAPGDVLDITELTTAKNPSNTLHIAVRSIGMAGRIVSRTRDGRTYALRLRDEDVRA